jgi:glyoxylase-like metal-dependent hydrolase (beta-lactamase superfamily II)
MKIHELHYSNTNTYLIEGDRGKLLFDTGWAGTFPAFCKACKDIGVSVQDIDHILISHFHPDHMGIAQEIADLGAVICVSDEQKDHIHAADDVFAKEKETPFTPIIDEKIRLFSVEGSRELLKEIGLCGEILYTPGHSDDSISLFLDDGSLFVGDLNPLYELELHKGTAIGESWEKLLSLNPKTVYYGHAKPANVGIQGILDRIEIKGK